jgi:DNA-binding CsgD family transcriptional regulator
MIRAIQEDESGRLWISTNRGLSRFEPATGAFTNYGIRDGLQGYAFNTGAAFHAADGRMFFGGVNGFNSFLPAAVRKNPFVPPVVWTGFARSGQAREFEPPFIFTGKLKIPYKFGFVTLDFAALCFIDPAGNRFAYKWEPQDDGWTDLGFARSVSFSDLDSGTYVLHVKASNPDGVWNEEGLRIPIEVIPPFWRTAWFLSIAALFLISGFLIVARKWRKLKAASVVACEQVESVVATYGLTAREEEILRLVLEGARNRDIEKKLFISASTVRNHIYNIYQKLGIKSRLELIHRIGKNAS